MSHVIDEKKKKKKKKKYKKNAKYILGQSSDRSHQKLR